MFYEVIPEGQTEALTYAAPEVSEAPRGSGSSGSLGAAISLSPGTVAIVPVGRRNVPGVVVKKVAQPDFKCKPIGKILYTTPLPRHLVATVRFIHEYYLAPSGAGVALVLPRGVEKQRRAAKTEHLFGFEQREEYVSPVALNSCQKNALKALQEGAGATKLLHGITGSGKTNVYLEMAARALERQKSTILLVPEIALTGQLVQVFGQVFKNRVIVMHSRQTEAERHLIFERILEADEPMIVVGARSALFAPLHDLGLIIIDEEHESTYYQENTPKYSAIRVASFMAKETGAELVLGSATPTAEDYYLAASRGAVVEMLEKAKTEAIKPEIKIVDLKNREKYRENRYFCDELLAATRRNLEKKQQTLIFHNRRGSSTLTICENCGEEILCPNCFLPLTLHADKYVLQCHTCGFSEKVPAGCPKCGHPGLIHKGFGTKLLETELRKLFPEARVRRFDADNKKGEGLEAVFGEVKAGEVDILVGTQAIAKGLDLPRLATVGVAAADAGLALPDFAAEERTFQLLTQVIGRVGRGHLETAEVFIQTFRPEHPVLKFAAEENYRDFYEYLLEQRKKGGFPPFMFVARLEITMKTEATVVKKVREAATKLAGDKRLVVSPPQPAFHERTARGYTWQIVARSRSRKALVEGFSGLDKNFRITLDPPSLL